MNHINILSYLGVALLILLIVTFPAVLIIFLLPSIIYFLYRSYLHYKDYKQLVSFKVKTSKKEPYNQDMDHYQKKSYMKSSKWKELKRQLLKRDNYQCQHCSSEESLQIHHITYTRLGDESLDQLITLCHNCHSKLHDKLGYSRYRDYPIEELK